MQRSVRNDPGFSPFSIIVFRKKHVIGKNFSKRKIIDVEAGQAGMLCSLHINGKHSCTHKASLLFWVKRTGVIYKYANYIRDYCRANNDISTGYFLSHINAVI